jgi:hypothetical protein
MTISIKGLPSSNKYSQPVALRFKELTKLHPNGTLFKVHSQARAYLFVKTGSNSLFELSGGLMYKLRYIGGVVSLHSSNKMKNIVKVTAFSVQKATLTLED